VTTCTSRAWMACWPRVSNGLPTNFFSTASSSRNSNEPRQYCWRTTLVGNGERFTCPCCGYLSFSEPPGHYQICEICFWEDDPVQLLDPRSAGGANVASLLDAQNNFAAHGWCEDRVAPYVRQPRPDDMRDETWRRLEPESADLEPVQESIWTGARIDLDKAYYWRRTRR